MMSENDMELSNSPPPPACKAAEESEDVAVSSANGVVSESSVNDATVLPENATTEAAVGNVSDGAVENGIEQSKILEEDTKQLTPLENARKIAAKFADRPKVEKPPPDVNSAFNEMQAAAVQEAAKTGAGSMPLLEQTGNVCVGIGAEKEAQLLGLGLPRLDFRQHDHLAKAKKYAMEQSIKHVLLKQTVAHQQNQQKIAMYAQALSLMARVYIGSVSFEIREETVKNAFGVFGPIKSINMSWDPVTGHHKGFAFLEYEVPEAALLAQEQMNGVLMGGRNIKVGRPSNMPQAQPIIEMVMEESKRFHRVYVASVHQDLTEADVRSVFEAFGKVVNAQLAKSASGLGHLGYGYIEYDNVQSATDAVASMNLFDLGGQHLRVGKAITPPQAQAFIVPTSAVQLPAASAVAAAHITAQIQALEATTGTNPIGQGQAPNVVVGLSDKTMATASKVLKTPGAVFSLPAPGLALPVPKPASGSNSPALGGSPTHAASPTATSAPMGVVDPKQERFEAYIPDPFAAGIPPPAVVQVGGLGEVPRPVVASVPAADVKPPIVPPPPHLSGPMAIPDQLPTTTTVMPPPPAPISKPVQKRPQHQFSQKAIRDSSGPVDNPDSALVLYDEDTDISKGPPKKKKKQNKKKKGKGADEMQIESPNPQSNIYVQQMNQSQTAARLLEAGSLSDKQKKLIESEAGATLAAQEDLKIKGNEARNVLMHKLMRQTESCVTVLRNMVGPEDVDEYLQEEVQEECSKYGEVDKVVIYQEKQGIEDDAEVIVKIFVKFSLPQEAEAAKSALDGRFFAGRTVKADIYDENLFDHNDLSG